MNSENRNVKFIQLYLLKSQFFDELNSGEIDKAKETFNQMDDLYKRIRGEKLTEILTEEELDKIDTLFSSVKKSKIDNIKGPTELDQFLR